MELRRHEEILLELLRAGLWKAELTFHEGFDEWTDVLELAKKQSVVAVIAKTILSDKEYQARIPNDFRLRLKSVVVSNVMTFNSMTQALTKVAMALHEGQIPFVLLKGHSLAVNYPYPELRQCGDIDIYVGKENSLATHRVLKGIADKLDPETDATWGKHYNANVGDLQIEIHRHTCEHSAHKYAKAYNAAADKGLTQNLQQVVFDDVTIPVPAVDFNAFYIFDHLFEHFLTSGIGLRHMSDWMLFLHANKDVLDRDNLRSLLEQMGMLKPWQIFGTVLVEYMGLPQEEFPLYEESDKTDWVLAYILSDGNFGRSTKYYTRRSESYFLTKLNAIWCHITRGIQMMRVFPRQEIRHFYHVIVNYLLHLRADIKKKLKHGR